MAQAQPMAVIVNNYKNPATKCNADKIPLCSIQSGGANSSLHLRLGVNRYCLLFQGVIFDICPGMSFANVSFHARRLSAAEVFNTLFITRNIGKYKKEEDVLSGNSQVVKDVGKWEWSEMWKKEDWWAIWLGFAILVAGMLIYFPQSGNLKEKLMAAETEYAQDANRTQAFKTIAWYELSDAKSKIKANSSSIGKWLSSVTKKTHGWTSNPLDGFFMSQEQADAKKAKAQEKYEKAKIKTSGLFAAAVAAETVAEVAGFKSQTLNDLAEKAIQQWRNAKFLEGKAKKKVSSAKPYNQVFKLIGLGVFFAVFFGIGIKAMGHSFHRFCQSICFYFSGRYSCVSGKFPGYHETLRHRVCSLGHFLWYAHLQHRGDPTMGHAGHPDRVLYQDRTGTAGRPKFCLKKLSPSVPQASLWPGWSRLLFGW